MCIADRLWSWYIHTCTRCMWECGIHNIDFLYSSPFRSCHDGRDGCFMYNFYVENIIIIFFFFTLYCHLRPIMALHSTRGRDLFRHDTWQVSIPTVRIHIYVCSTHCRTENNIGYYNGCFVLQKRVWYLVGVRIGTPRMISWVVRRAASYCSYLPPPLYI